MERTSLPPFELFYSCASEDDDLRRRLNHQLAPVCSKHQLLTWHRSDVPPGEDRQYTIRKHLQHACIILLLVSPAFQNSIACNQEVHDAMERLKSKEAVCVIPILLRPVSLEGTPYAHLQPLPKNERPVTAWANRDTACKDIAESIDKVLTSILPPPPPSNPNPRIGANIYPRIEKLANLKILGGAVLLAIIASLLVIPGWRMAPATSSVKPPPPIRTWKTPSGEQVGLSDGRFAFDTDNRSDGTAKRQAAHALASGQPSQATLLWQKAIQQDPTDAESLIYQEDQRVLASGRPFLTLVIATILTGENAQVGRDDLQGAYVAQKEFNSASPSFQIRLLIANSGSGDESVAGQVAQQIVQATREDQTIVGVMGWPFSESTLSAVKVLGTAHIPLVAETASTDQLSGISPYFFRIIPPDFQQSKATAHYIVQDLHAKRVALFVDPHNAYSQSFADDFRQAYLEEGPGNQIVVTESYTVGSAGQASLSTLLHHALDANPDVLYFAGYANDLSVLLDALPSSGPGAHVPIVGGEGLYELGGYDHSARAHLGQLHFLSYAYPDEWRIAGLTKQEPAFFQEYNHAFNPSGKVAPGHYGVTRADNDVIVAYDATQTLFAASTAAQSGQLTKHITPQQLQQALALINDQHPLQGVSGRIAFGPDGNPINKPLLLLSVDEQAHIHEDMLLSGCLQVAQCT